MIRRKNVAGVLLLLLRSQSVSTSSSCNLCDGAVCSATNGQGDTYATVKIGECPLSPNTIYLRFLVENSDEFYQSSEAFRIAETILAYQSSNGGWIKNYDALAVLDDTALAQLRATRDSRLDTTIDNEATYTEIEYLALVNKHQPSIEMESAITNGLQFLLNAQYENGGWPQVYPTNNDMSYENHITFNDNAVVGVLSLLRIVHQDPNELFTFLPQTLKQRVVNAVQKGIDVILKTQIVVDGTFKGWCGQHDRETLLPQQGRSYEPPSICGRETARIVQFLMRLEDPSLSVINAIESAVAWLDCASIMGKGYLCIPNQDDGSSKDRILVDDPQALPLWARFYDIPTNRPIFQDRDGQIYDSLDQVSRERRIGYDYFVDHANTMFCEDYPIWMENRPFPAENENLPTNNETDASCSGLDFSDSGSPSPCTWLSTLLSWLFSCCF